MTRIAFILFTTIALLTAPFSQALADNSDLKPLPEDKQSCVSEFALCTSAPCIPDPSDPDGLAICTCEVTTGPNFALYTPCDQRGKTTVNGKAIEGIANPETYKTIVSTYGFIQAATKPVMTCDTKAPWTDCLDAPCIVDPKDPLRAICSCPYAEQDPDAPTTFVTYGGSCNTNTCETAVWSAATQAAFQAGSVSLITFLGLREQPFAFCPPQDPAQ